MKKSSFFNFLPTKAEEGNRRHGEAVPSTEVEIREMGPRTQTTKYIGDKWPITKVLTNSDIEKSRLILPQGGHNGTSVFDNILRYLPRNTVENVLAGLEQLIQLKDVDNGTYHEVTLSRYQGDNTFGLKGKWKTEIVNGRKLQAGHLIGLSWNAAERHAWRHWKDAWESFRVAKPFSERASVVQEVK